MAKSKTQPRAPTVVYPMCGLQDALAILGLDSSETLKNWRESPESSGLLADIHYRKVGDRRISYNVRLLESWVHHDPKKHQQEIEKYVRWCNT